MRKSAAGRVSSPRQTEADENARNFVDEAVFTDTLKAKHVDAGLHPTLLKWLSVGSSLDRSANLGADLWQHHFGSVLTLESDLT